jgi:hypothetical protein
VIVLDAGDSWQLVLQPDHADLSAAFANSWGNDAFASPRPRSSLVLAMRRHDDGWAVWERWPRLDRKNGEVRPTQYRDVSPRSHLAFYRAAIADITETDEYAGLLISMHGAGIYRGRYGTQPELARARAQQTEEFGAEIDAFVAEQEAGYAVRIAALAIPDEERWVNYKLVQTFDRLALYFSGLLKLTQDDVHVLSPVPVDYDGAETELTITALSSFEPFSPRHVRVEPFPFTQSPARFELVRRVLPKRQWLPEEFVHEFAAAPSETVDILVEA